MSKELHAFRSELAGVSPEAEARVRGRLEARIAAEGRRPATARPRARIGVPALTAALLALAVLVAATALTEGSSPAPELRSAARSHPIASELDRGNRGPSRTRRADGLVVALPSLDGRDAGTRPNYDRGGWSECATNGCYWES
jgi:hypothetical protein